MLKDPPYNDGRHLSPEKQGLGASPSHRHKKETEHRFSDFAAFPSGHQGVCLGQWVSDFSVSPLSIMRTLKSDFFPHASYFYWHCVRNESWEHLKIFHFEILMNWFHVITYNIFMKTIFQKKKRLVKVALVYIFDSFTAGLTEGRWTLAAASAFSLFPYRAVADVQEEKSTLGHCHCGYSPLMPQQNS